MATRRNDKRIYTYSVNLSGEQSDRMIKIINALKKTKAEYFRTALDNQMDQDEPVLFPPEKLVIKKKARR